MVKKKTNSASYCYIQETFMVTAAGQVITAEQTAFLKKKKL